MIKIVGEVVGTEKVRAEIRAWSVKVWRRVHRAMQRLTIELQSDVKEKQLSGNALQVRTGRLRRSITREVIDGETNITGLVGTNVGYGAAWELGHERRLGWGTRGLNFSRMGDKALARYQAKHPRLTKTYAPRPFLRPELDALRDRIAAKLSAAMKEE